MRVSTTRERHRLRTELKNIKGALHLLMKPRNGLEWTYQERTVLAGMLRSASSVSPYLIVLALPGSVILLPILAWHLDVRRSRRGDLLDGPRDLAVTAKSETENKL